jgi:hypothetical protein
MAEAPNLFNSPAQYKIEQLVSGVHANYSQEIIQINSDRAYRYLIDWKMKLESSADLIGRLSLFSTLSLTLLTADFKDRFGVNKGHWEAICLALMMVSLLWLGKTLWGALFNRPESVERMVEKFKNAPPPPAKLGIWSRMKTYYSRGHYPGPTWDEIGGGFTPARLRR